MRRLPPQSPLSLPAKAGNHERLGRLDRPASSMMSADEGLELVEERGPAALAVVTCGLVEELGVMEDHQRPGTVGLQRNRDQRLALGRRVPGPGEDQALVRHDLAIDAAGLEIFAVVAVEADAIAAAGADVELGVQR